MLGNGYDGQEHPVFRSNCEVLVIGSHIVLREVLPSTCGEELWS